jgi:cytochrome c
MKRILLVLASMAAGLAVSTPALADLQLATAKNCMTCHAVDKKLAAKITKGGSGVWGPVPMPANPQVSPDEAKKLAAWILATK